MNRTRSKQPLNWYKTLQQYYKRAEWELYDLRKDPEELNNIAGKISKEGILKDLQERLNDWQKITNDPWICAPHSVYENTGIYKNNPQCMSLDNDFM